jgi:hypothetical protein
MSEKMCRKCGLNPAHRGGLCKPCINARAKVFRKKNWERLSLELSARALGVSYDELKALVDAHSGFCDICGNPPMVGPKKRLETDHDHETGEIRGFLCVWCNRGLGCFKDDPALLRAAADYTEKNK